MAARMLFAVAALCACGIAWAATPIVPSAPGVAADAFILIDADTRKVIAESNSEEPLPPASLTKLMTGYVAAAELEIGRLSLSDQVHVSVNAWRTEGSRTFIQEGTQVSVENLLRGIIIQSGNDATVALAEHIAGDEGAFADLMNRHAEELGMSATRFRNATGLPAEDHYSSAKDLAILTREYIRRFPDNYAIYSERSFKYNDIEQPNRNRLLWRDSSVDGVKTGHTDAAGYCLIASALRDGMRLISVVMGAADGDARMRETQKLFAYGYRYFKTRRLHEAHAPLAEAPIWYGEEDSVQVGLAEPVVITLVKGAEDALQRQFDLDDSLEAPLAAGQEIGVLRLILEEETIYSAPLVALQAVEESGVFSRFGDFIERLLQGSPD